METNPDSGENAIRIALRKEYKGLENTEIRALNSVYIMP